MNILIRTDSSLKMGSGHLMRCLTLADGLTEKGADIHFICRNLQGNLNYLVQERGYHLHLLPGPKDNFEPQADDTIHASWLEVSWQDDLNETKGVSCFITKKFNWLIIDSYALDYRWENGMRIFSDRIMVIDDMADRKHNCDLLLDQNYFSAPEKRYDNLVSDNCLRVLGPQYALLRPEFRRAREFSKIKGSSATRILIYFGGNDHDNLTGMALDSLSCPELEHLCIDVVVGPHNPHIMDLQEQINCRSKTRLHVQPKGFVELLLRADLCIGAGGTTTWERFCLNTPGVVITTALNQEAFNSELDEAGFLCCLGTKEDVSVQKIKAAALDEILKLDNKDYLSYPTLVDGLGALRIAEILLPSSKDTLIFRLTVMSDMEFYFSWVNDPIARKYAFSHENISWENHKAWFEKKINSSSTAMWIIETAQGLPVGQIRFDIQDSIAEIDYSLDPYVRGRRWANTLLTKGINAFTSKYKQILVQARVKNKNHPSCAAFKRIALAEEKPAEGVTLFHLT